MNFLSEEEIQRILDLSDDSDGEEWAPVSDEEMLDSTIPYSPTFRNVDVLESPQMEDSDSDLFSPGPSTSTASTSQRRRKAVPNSKAKAKKSRKKDDDIAVTVVDQRVDPGPTTAVPKFTPKRMAGLHLPECFTRGDLRKFLRPVDFFFLFFTYEIMNDLCQWTNVYANEVGVRRMSLYERWSDIDVEGLYQFIALLMYMSVVKVPRVTLYWCEKTLLKGLWARRFMSVWRYKCLMSFLKISDFRTEDRSNKITKAEPLMFYIRDKCKELFQPYQNISIDERMVKNKGRYSFRMYMKDKPTKWGMKLWVLADSSTGYTYDFDVYLGKTQQSSPFGLAYGVVEKLVKSLLCQGYHLFFDNFYTSVNLMKYLVSVGIRACGTILVNRMGFPDSLKDVKVWEKKVKRGDMRWHRDGDILALQWKDNKTVSFLSTIHDANTQGTVHRRSKDKGEFRRLEVKQPQLVRDYNQNMNGVDLSDQLIGKYNSLRKTNKWWKSLFLHFIDIARVNSYILFTEFRKSHPDILELSRPPSYNQLDFTLELIRQLGGIEDDEPVPVLEGKVLLSSHSILPFVSKKRGNCKRCYSLYKKVVKSRHGCSACNSFFCFQEDRNCLLDFHTRRD